MIALLRGHPALRPLLLGAGVSALGDVLTWIALSWLVLERAGGAAVGAVLLAFALPSALTAPLWGRLLDRFDPRTLLLADNLLRAPIIAAVPLLAALGVLELWHVYTLAALAGALAPLTGVGLRVVLPALVNDDDLEAGNAALAGVSQLSTLAGPVLGGVLVRVWGAANVLWLDAASFLVMAWAISRLPRLSRPASTVPRARATLAPLLRDPVVLTLTLLGLAFYFAYGPMEVALPVQTREVLGGGAGGYGLLVSLVGAGMLLSNLAAPWLGRRARPALLGGIAVAWGAAQAGLGLSTSYPLSAALALLAGVAWGPYTALEVSTIQRRVPPEVLGAVFGARAALLTPAAPLGTAFGGALLGGLSSAAVLSLSGALCVLAGLTGMAVLARSPASPREARVPPASR